MSEQMSDVGQTLTPTYLAEQSRPADPQGSPHSTDTQGVTRAFDVDPELGLLVPEVSARRARYGTNTIQSVRPRALGASDRSICEYCDSDAGFDCGDDKAVVR